MSTYQYITGDDLEAFAINIYDTTDPTYTEAVVMGQVSEAERWVNEYCKQSFTAEAAPDGVESATLHMARYLMNVQMLGDGHIKEMPATLKEVESICKEALKNNKLSLDYSTSRNDFDLRNRVG